MLEIEDEIRNGTILCRLGEVMSGERIKGVFKEPKSDATSMVNLRKAFECFRRLPRIDRKHLWAEREVLRGDKNAIFSLLESLRKYHETHSSDRPSYLADQLGAKRLEKRSVERARFNATTVPQSSTVRLKEIPAESAKQPRPDNSLQAKRNSSNHNSIKRDLELLSSKKTPLSQSIVRGNFPAARQADIYPKSIAEMSRSGTSLLKTGGALDESSNLGVDEEQRRIIDWLEVIGVKLPEYFSLCGSTLEAFKDGVLLCQIVGILEKKNIEGIVVKPRSVASAKHNIRKALGVLNKKSAIPFHYLEATEEIYNGDAGIILGLLKLLRKVYRSHLTHLEHHRNTIQLRSRILSNFNSTLSLRKTKAPFGTVDADGIDDTEPLNTSLSKPARKLFLIPPGKAWN